MRYKLFILLLVGFGCGAWAADFPSDKDLRKVPLGGMPDEKALASAMAESRQAWDKFRNQVEGFKASFPNIQVGENQERAFDSIVSSTRAAQADFKPKLLVFASFSMPKPRLKRLIEDVSQAGGAVLLRGLVADESKKPSFKATAYAINDLHLGKGEGLQIAPNLFSRYGVEFIPAFFVFKDGACMKCGENHIDDYKSVYGDVSLKYALRDISRRDVSFAPVIESLLHKLENSFFGG